MPKPIPVEELLTELDNYVFPKASPVGALSEQRDDLAQRYHNAFWRLAKVASQLEFDLTMQKKLFDLAVGELRIEIGRLQHMVDASIAGLDPDRKPKL